MNRMTCSALLRSLVFVCVCVTTVHAQGVGADSLRLGNTSGGSAWLSIPSGSSSSYRLILPSTLGSLSGQLMIVNGLSGQVSLLSPGNTSDLLRLSGSTPSWISPDTVISTTAWSLRGNAATNPASMFLGTTDAQPLLIKTNNTERLRILSGGNVGIGTSTPSSLVHLRGGNLLIDTSASGTAGQLRLMNPAGTFYTALRAGAQALNLTMTLPTSAPSSGQFLSSDASGNLSWTSLASLASGTTNNSTLRYNSATSQWVENTNVLSTSSGALTLGSNSNAGSLVLSDGQVSSKTATISSSTLAANRAYSVPDAGTNASFVMTEGAQTINGSKSFSSNLLLTNTGTATELRFYEPSASGNNYTAFKSQAQSVDLSYTLPAADGSSGQVLSTNGSTTLSWISPSTVATAMPISGLTAATTTNSINNADYAQTWQWNSLSSSTALSLSSSSTAATLNTQKLLGLSLSGANASATQTTYGLYATNTHTGTSSTNVAAYLSASGATNNYALLAPNGYVGIGTSTPTTTLTVNGASRFSGGVLTIDTSAASTAGQIQFYNPARTFSSTFKAGAQTANIDYTLPTSTPGSGYVLSSTGAGVLSWVDPTTASTSWQLSGNSGTNSSTNYIGTSDAQSLIFKVSGSQELGLIVTTSALQRDGGGNARGTYAVDLQRDRTTSAQVASGLNASIGGGKQNTASGDYSVVSGGKLNTANNTYSSVLGGNSNTASGLYSVSSGGDGNTASGDRSIVAGGSNNVASGSRGTVVGGNANTASGANAFIGAGLTNTSSNQNSFIGAGSNNTASAAGAAVVAGSYNTSAAGYGGIVSGLNNYVSGASDYAFIGAGLRDSITNRNSFIGSGSDLKISGYFSFIGSGDSSTISSMYASVVGGQKHTVSGAHAFIGGGLSNTISAAKSAILGGENNSIASTTSSILGGSGLTLSSGATSSMGFLANSSGSYPATLATQRTFFLGNTDLWIGNNDNLGSRELRFYTNSSTTGSFPAAGQYYSSFKAAASQAANVSYTLPGADGSTGQVLSTNGSGTLSWSTPSTSATAVPLSGLTAATATNSINSADYAQTWQWNTLSSNTALSLSSSSTAASSNTQKLLGLALSGANSTASQTTYSLYATNTHTGTTSTNVGAYISASGGTNNYALVVPSGYVGIGTSAPTTPLMVNGASRFSGGNITIDTSAASTAGLLQFYNPARTFTTSLRSGASAANTTYTLPTADGSSGQVLATDGSGNLSWTTKGSGSITGSGSNTQVAWFNGASSLASSSNMIWDNTNSRLGIFASSPVSRLQVGGRIVATIGTDNTMISGGNETMSGTLNSALGYNALGSITSGGSNVAVGRNTLSSLTSTNNNTAVGTGALGITSGSNNIAIGYQAGDALSSGSNNIIIGYDIDAPSASGSNQLSIGNLIYGTSLNGSQTTISSGNIGIGYSAPSQRLHVAGNILVDTSAASTAGKILFNNPARTFATSLRAGAQTANIDYTWPTSAPSAGQYLQSDASGNLSWQNAASSTALSAITAATATNSINSADYAQTWQWNSLSSNSALTLSSSSTAAASNTQKLLNLSLSGANASASQTTYALSAVNSHSGTSSTNIAGYFVASGGTNNYSIVAPSGYVGIGTGTPTTTLHVNGSSRFSGGTLSIDTSAASTAGTLQFYNPARTFSTSFKAGANAANVTYTLPTADGSSNQLLSTNGSGTLSWVTAGATITYGVNSPSAYSADQTDLSLSTSNSVFRVSSTTAINLNSIVAGSNGRQITIINVGSQAITFKHQSATGTAANKLILSKNADAVLNADDMITLIYDATTARWREMNRNF